MPKIVMNITLMSVIRQYINDAADDPCLLFDLTKQNQACVRAQITANELFLFLLFQHASLKLWTFSPRLTVDFYFLYILLLKKVGE